jgi:hypothetical protein
MKSARTTAAVAAGSMILAIVASSPAGAGEPPPTGTITVDPPSPLTGDAVVFTGKDVSVTLGPVSWK